MARFVLPKVAPEGFSIGVEEKESTLRLDFRGVADMAAIEPLSEFLHAVHREALAHRLRTVNVDFRALEFMNSSCFKSFVEWLGDVQDLPADERYAVAFDANRAMHWQNRSLNALRCFAMDVVTVEVH